MTSDEGGFYSAEDADSVPPERAGEPHPHKTEGAFYIWSDEEIGALLGDDADDRAASTSGSSLAGTLRAIPRASSPARTSLHIAQSIAGHRRSQRQARS